MFDFGSQLVPCSEICGSEQNFGVGNPENKFHRKVIGVECVHTTDGLRIPRIERRGEGTDHVMTHFPNYKTWENLIFKN